MKLYMMGFVIGFRNREIIGLPDFVDTIARISPAVILLISLLALSPWNAMAQTGIISGNVTDAQTGEALPLAKVSIDATGQNVITDRDGRYILRGVAAGNHTISVRYLGYNTAGVAVSVGSGERVIQAVELHKDFIEGDRMFVTAAQRRQATALNRQLRSKNPVSVVTLPEMERFADYTVEEAIIRIPGVQAGGRGEISLRGAGLGMHNVTVDGQQLATTGNDDRSFDLGMLSTGLLRNVEVIRVITPDMNADAVGGVVNLVTYHPLGGERQIDVQAGGGANAHYLDMTGPDSRASVRYSETMTDDLSISLKLNQQRLSRSFENILIGYDVADFNDIPTDVMATVSPGMQNDTRNMYGALLQLTWQPSDISTFHVRGMVNHEDRQLILHRSRWLANNNWVDPEMNVVGGRFRYDFGRRDVSSTQYTFQGGGRHLLDFMDLEYRLGWARSNVEDIDLLMPFQSTSGVNFKVDMADRSRPDISLTEMDLPLSQQMILQTVKNVAALNVDNNFSGRIDAKIPLGPLSLQTGSSASLAVKDVNDLGAYTDYELAYRGFLRLNEFEKNWQGTEVFDRYDIPWLAQGTEVSRFYSVNSHIMARNFDLYRATAEYRNYKVRENVYSGYGMATFEMGNLAVMGGVRLEYTDSKNDARLIEFDRFGRYFQTTDTSRVYRRSDLFPHAQVVFTPHQNSRILLAYSKTMSRPDYIMLSPFGVVNRRDTTLFRGNPALDPMFANNFDLYLEHYFMNMGSVTLGLFYKDLDNFFFLRKSRVDVREGEFSGLDPMFARTDDEVISVHQTIYRNTDESASLYGFELSWQQNLDFLPGILSNLGAYAGYTWSHSVFDTDRDDDVALPYQSPHVLNASLDYSAGRFFAKVSYHWTAEMLSHIAEEVALAPSVSRNNPVYLDRYQYGWSDLSATLRFRISDNFRLWVDAVNLLPERNQVIYEHTRDLYPTTIDLRRGTGIKLGIRYDL